jgi:sugar phosphate isomerase/epimerase
MAGKGCELDSGIRTIVRFTVAEHDTGGLRSDGRTMPRLAVFPKGFFDAIVSREMTLSEWIALAGTLEVDGLELYPRFLDDFETATLARVRREAADRDLSIPMLCCSPDFTDPDPAARRRAIDTMREMFRVTRELGGTFCRVLSGQDRPGLEEHRTMHWVIDALRDLEPAARDTGVVMCLENHYKDGLWTFPEFAQRHDRYLAILDAVKSPHLKVQFDPSNAIVAGEDQYELLARVLPRVATMHASDRYLEGGTIETLRHVARDPQQGYAAFVKHGVIGEGLNDYDRIFAMLAGAGFDGWISIEDGEGPTVELGMDNLRRSAAFLRAAMDRHWPA